MGFEKSEDDSIGEIPKPDPLSDALLFATMGIVGLPVELHVRDGSLYSGIFHTASFDNGYGIILKKARKIRKGKREKNFTVGSLIDTLVVLSSDLVQIVAKDFLLPAGVSGEAAGDSVETAAKMTESQACSMGLERETKSFVSVRTLDLHNVDAKVDEGKMLQNPSENKQQAEAREQNMEKVEESSLAIVSVQDRQVGEELPQRETNSCNHLSRAKKMEHADDFLSHNTVFADDTHGATKSNSTSNGTRCSSPAHSARAEYPERICATSTNCPTSDGQNSTLSTSASVADRTPSCPGLSTSPNLSFPKNLSSNTSSKEFKLNPGAKVFSPLSANSRSALTSIPTVTNTGYMSNIPPVMPFSAGPSGVEISSFGSIPSLPAKLVQYNSHYTGQSGVTAQYARPIVGHPGARHQPIRFSAQYHPVQAAPTYVHPPTQAVMVGRLGQLMYVHPIAQDTIQGTSVLPQGSPYPLLNSCQANMPKFQGNAAQSLQLCMAQPLVAGATQPFAMPSHIPFTQPFPTFRPIPVPGTNGFFGGKFQ